MRSLYFLLPGTNGKFACGGLFAELKTVALAQKICDAAIVTYQQREPDTLFLEEVLLKPEAQNAIFVVSWGFHVPKLIRRLRGYSVVYHAHSAGYGFRVPSRVPILTVSRNTMGYWGQWCPTSPIYLLPNQISPEFSDRGRERDIDVLVQARKSSQYLLKQLFPALQTRCHVVLLDSFVDDLADLFNRSRVYLYDTAEYWAQYRVTEGFGLPPMEAMACGCQVFSSVNGALSDYLDPGFNCERVGVYSTQYDVERILKTLEGSQGRSLPPTFFDPYREETILPRLKQILVEINQFFDHVSNHSSDITPLSDWRLTQLRLKKVRQKIVKKLKL